MQGTNNAKLRKMLTDLEAAIRQVLTFPKHEVQKGLGHGSEHHGRKDHNNDSHGNDAGHMLTLI